MDRMTKQDELVFLPLGGSGEIGMNFNAYGFGPPDDRQWIIVDCGVLFGREGNTPGVDLIMPDIRYLVERRENVLAINAVARRPAGLGPRAEGAVKGFATTTLNPVSQPSGKSGACMPNSCCTAFAFSLLSR